MMNQESWKHKLSCTFLFVCFFFNADKKEVFFFMQMERTFLKLHSGPLDFFGFSFSLMDYFWV